MKKIYLFILFSFSFFVKIQGQCSMYLVPINQRLNNSSLVIEGKVLNKQSFWDNNHQLIYTSNVVEVYKLFKGSLASNHVEVITKGGMVGDELQLVSPSLELAVGDIGMFTLTNSSLSPQFNYSVFDVYAGPQGFIKYDLTSLSATDPFEKYDNISNDLLSKVESIVGTTHTEISPLVIPTSNSGAKGNSTQSIASISGFSPSVVAGGTGASITINGSGFGSSRGSSFVEFPNANDGGQTYTQPHSSQYVSWTDNQIVVQVPATAFGSPVAVAGSGKFRVDVGGTKYESAQDLTISYAAMNLINGGSIHKIRPVNMVNGGYSFSFNSSNFDTNIPAKDAFFRSLQRWRCATGINFSVGATTSVNVKASDGTSVVRFASGDVPPGALGECYSYFSGCSSGTLWYLKEMDITYESSVAWDYGPGAPGGGIDFESVTAHEIGHGHLLGHTNNPYDIMQYVILTGQEKRLLSQNDIDGGNNIMALAATGGICSRTIHLPVDPSSCVLTSPSTDFSCNRNSVCVGESVSFTDLSSGSPTAWSWTFEGGTPATSSSQNPSITYSTPGTYSVSLTSTNGFGSLSRTKTLYITVNNASSLPFSEGFEGGTFLPNGWSHKDDGNDGLKWEKAFGIGGFGTSSGSAFFNNYSYDVIGRRDEIRTPPIALTSVTAPKLTFDVAYGYYPSTYTESLSVLVSADCGATWTQVYSKSGTQLATATFGSFTNFTPTAGQWRKDTVDLTSYIGTNNLMVAFQNYGHYVNKLYIDNVNIAGTVVGSAPVANFNLPASACLGSAVTFTDQSTNTPTGWSWSFSNGTPSTSGSQTPSSVTFSVAGTQTVTLTSSNTFGSNSISKTISIIAPPTLSITPANASICAGQTTTLTASGATSYTWNPGGLTTNSITVNPSSTTGYTVTGDNSGCTSTTATSVTVNSAPTISVSTSSLSVCPGQSSILSATGATSYTWMPGNLTGTSVTVTPTSTTDYTVTGNDGTCNGTTTINITVTPAFSLSVSPSTTICPSQSATLTASGATSYTWNPGNLNTNSITVNPTSTTEYTVFGSNGGACGSSTTTTVFVSTIGTLTVNASSSSLCSGETTTLSVSGASSYTWNPGNLSGSSITVTPTSTTEYTVVGTNGSCTGSNSILITVNPPPTVSASANSYTVCSGEAVSLSATGATNYTWMPGGLTGGTITVNPTSTTDYTVTGANGSCTSASSVLITVTSNSIALDVTGINQICEGDATSLFVTGATSYTWNPGNVTGNSIFVGPSSTTEYTVTGANGACTSYTTYVVTVTPTPTLIISGPTSTCLSNTVTLTATGATNYTWMPGSINTPSISVSPTSLTIYTLTGSTNNCTSTITHTLDVVSTLTISASASNYTVCSGGLVNLSATGATSYTWNPGNLTGSPVTVNPTTTTEYTVDAGDGGCSGSTTINITVNSTPPTITASSSSYSICSTETATLSASGATNYTWMPGGITGGTITVNPNSTTEYTVTGANGSCTGVSTILINVSPTPTLTISGPASICAGVTTTLTVTGVGAASYLWMPGNEAKEDIVVTPTSTTIYTVTGYNNNCTSVLVHTLEVIPTPTIVASADSYTVCEGKSVNLSASGGVVYMWEPGSEIGSNFLVTPTSTTEYTVYGEYNGCTGSDTVLITVLAKPTFSVTNKNAICSGESITLAVTGTNSYNWEPGSLSGSTVTVTPFATTDYTVTGTDANSCSNAVVQTISVTPQPTVSLSVNSVTICAGQPVIVSASGANTYSWSPASSSSNSITVSPTSSTVYSVSGYNDGCVDNETVSIIVNSLPVFTVSSSTIICSGTTATLTANGTTSYVWMPGNLTGSSVVVSPTSTTTYTVTGDDGICSANKTTVVNVTAQPSVTITPAFSSFCSGSNISLSATGATSYTWNPGGLNGSSVIVSPSSTTIYTVTGRKTGCTGTETATVTIDLAPQTPTITIIGNTLTCSPAADHYQWYLNGVAVSTATTQIHIATLQGNYTVESYTSNGCQSLPSSSVFYSTTNIATNTPQSIDLDVIPNPNNGAFNVVVGNIISNGYLKIINALGQVVVHENFDAPKNNSSLSFKFSSLNEGLYYVIVGTKNGQKNKTIIIQ